MITDKRSIDITNSEPLCSNKTLIMMHGLPRSGKSTWANILGHPVVNLDSIRLVMTGKRWYGPIEHEVHAIARTMIRALFVAGHDYVIVDSCNYTRQERDEFIASADVPWNRGVILVMTPSEVCKKRAKETYPELIPVIDWFVEHQEKFIESENIKILGVQYGT